MAWIKRLAINSLLVAGSVLVVLLVVEGALRFTHFAALLPYEGTPRYYYAESREGGYDIAKNFATSTHRFVDLSYSIWSNNIGCFDMPYHGEQPYLLLVGDSFAWGFTPFDDKWGTLLERYLGERVLKCGVGGYGARQELAKATALLGGLPEPQTIIVSYFANDEGDDAAFPNSLPFEGQLIKNLSGDPTLTYDELVERLPQYAAWGREYCMWNEPAHPTLQRTKCLLRRHSVLYLLAQDTIKQVVPVGLLRAVGVVNAPPPSVAVTDTSLSEHWAAVVAFKTLAQTHHAALLFVLVPPKEDVYSSATSTTYDDVKTFLAEQGITYFDPLTDFRSVAAATTTPLYWPNDPHLNPVGNHLLGLLVARHMLESEDVFADEKLQKVEAQLQQEFDY